jgi:hypothetical protein
MSREQTGKTPISTILARMGIVYSTPLVVLVLIFVLSGVWVLIVPFVIGWMGMVFAWTAFQYLVVHAFTNARHGHDAGYQAWKQGGGDVFFDAQGFPFNFDSVETKVATPTPHYTTPPDPACPRCGHVGWTLWEGRQCPVCYSYWDEAQQRYMYWQPDPRMGR